MTNKRFALKILGLALVVAGVVGGGVATAANAQQTLRVGIMSGEDEDVWRVVSANAEKQGLTIKITTFNDYTQPNEALESRDLDANAFQHKPYLDAQIKAKGYHIDQVGYTYVQPIGLYSRKWKSVSQLPDGAIISVPNDPSNEGRALLLLQAQGVITLRKDVGLLPTVTDIDSNPKHVHVKELDAGVIGRSISDVDAAVVNTDWAIKAGIKIPQERIAQERVDGNPYRNFIAVRAADEHAPWVQTLVKSYQQKNVAEAILNVYHGATIPAWDGAPQK
jgi:D-methionine transport system substrate-binding protein